MTEGESTYNLIERYLNGEMDAAEKESFRQSMTPETEAKLKAHNLTNQLIKENRLLNVKALAQQSHISSSRLNRNIKAGIISGVIIIGAAYFWPTSQKETIPASEFSKPESQLVTKENKTTDKEPTAAETPKEVKKPSPKAEKNFVVDSGTNQAIQEVIPAETDPVSIEKLRTEEPKASVTPGPNEAKTIKPICENVKIEARVFALPACTNESNGSITVSGYSGGKPPYHTSLTHDSYTGLSLNELKQGSYNLHITDANNCESVIPNVQVKNKVCQKNHHFNPFIGEKWEVPASKLKGTLVIKDNAGNTYFTNEIQAETQEYWTGQSISGEMKPGYYLYIIQYSDGNTVQGSVTVVQ